MSLNWVPISRSSFRCPLAWPSCHMEFLCEHWLLHQSICSPSDFGHLSDFSHPFLCEKRSVDLLCSIRKLRLQDFLICKQYQDVTITYTGCCKPFVPIKMPVKGQSRHLEEIPLFAQARDAVLVLMTNTPLSRKC